MDKNIKILDTVWYGTTTVSHFTPAIVTTVTSWAVLIWNWHKIKAFIWCSDKNDEQLDTQEIADWGNEISKKVALAIFWKNNYYTNNWKVSITLDY